MAEAVVSFVVERLGDFIIQQGKFLYGVSDQVELAQTELQLMKGFLKDADARQSDDETVRIWVAKIREAACDLEDVIEIYALKVACKREGGIKSVLKRFGCMLKEGVDLHKIGAKIRVITTNISDLRLCLQTYNIRELRESTEGVTSVYERQQQLRRTYSHIMDRDVTDTGWLGKTTLAKQVYHDREVRQHFDSFAWVCISQRCQVRDVWEEILIKVSALQREENAKMKDGEIAKKLYLVQQESKCLVVIDDVWSVGTWDTLKAAFPLYSGISTRKKDLGKKMLRYCSGLPLPSLCLQDFLQERTQLMSGIWCIKIFIHTLEEAKATNKNAAVHRGCWH
ncbi:putative P-loop containing nucleoside triphosphate hydrolase [Rosa chinensis]|uniref:Putative P-loop containing nucleoside triphosphate hydrolase n=1 Tax=Rosa chinensis TaxID=74649 RepID=A0A2P6R047_ROSCH|nr:putative P-loop containing nucleoside triphosphate hydrolase [Rosa chinensis]